MPKQEQKEKQIQEQEQEQEARRKHRPWRNARGWWGAYTEAERTLGGRDLYPMVQQASIKVGDEVVRGRYANNTDPLLTTVNEYDEWVRSTCVG